MNGNYYPPINDIYPSTEPGAHLKRAFGSGLFLSLCVLMSVILLFSVISVGHGKIEINEGGFNLSLSIYEFLEDDIFTLLLVIGMWMTYASASGIRPFNVGGLKVIKVVLTITIVIEIIECLLCILAGIAVSILGTVVPADSYINVVYDALTGLGYGELIEYIEQAMPVLPMIFLVIGLAIMLVAVVILIIDALFYHNLLHCTESLIKMGNDPTALPHSAKASAMWILVFAIIKIPGAIHKFNFSFITTLSTSGALIKCIVMIISYVFLKKYFIEPYAEGRAS